MVEEMRTSPENPKNNQIPAGVDVAELTASIELSGYPLQGIVASKLVGSFGVTEEWGFVDRDTQEHRNLDVFAYHPLADDKSLSVQPSLALLIECKRSRFPYIFFQRATDQPIRHFPTIAGLPYGRVQIYEQNGNKMREEIGAVALSLNKHPFVNAGPAVCSAFCRANLNGKKVELSGSETYNSIVLPLSKALDHAYQLYKAQEKATTIFPVLMICVNVLDAPMMLVEDPQKASDPILTPWVRVVRQEANADNKSWEKYKFNVIDTVHVDYFDDFINHHLLPLAIDFKQRSIQLADILFNGGEVPNLDTWNWEQIQTRSKK